MKQRLVTMSMAALLALAVTLPGCGGGGEAPPHEITHQGVVVRVTSDDPARKPFLRVDVLLQYSPDVAKNDSAKITRITGAEGQAIISTGLLSNLPSAEEIEADQVFHMEEAADMVREALTQHGFPPPMGIYFPNWVIQG